MDALLGGDWLATARFAGTLIIGYVALMWLASVIWTYRDISSRTQDQVSQAVMVGIVVALPIIGLPIYLALRPAETLQQSYDREIEQEAILADIQTQSACPSCRRPAEPDFRVCAYCGTALKEPCPRCNELMLHAWRYCPHCATPRARAAMPPATATAPTRLDFSAGDDAYDEPPAPAPIAARPPAAEAPSSATAAQSNASRAPLRRRTMARVPASEAESTSRTDVPRPTPARRQVTEE
ncbi:MAG: zinc ribbon domain-containing protein [Dehalococcoidia bacterium]